MSDPDLTSVRKLILEYGWNATVYQILNPGIGHWFPQSRQAVVGYVEHAGYRIVAGAPVCAYEELPAVVSEFEADAARKKLNVCYFGAEARLESVLGRSARHSMIHMGAQPSWDPGRWPRVYEHHASLRAQLNRARNKGVKVVEWEPLRATSSIELHKCLAYWLKTRHFPTMHFLVEPETLERLFDRRIFVAERKDEVIGFLVASPVPQRNGWLIEQMVRGRGAVNGMVELLIDTAVNSMSSSAYLTLGLAPLSPRAGSDQAPIWFQYLRDLVRRYASGFYNFEGLEQFKAKFQPEVWEPVYAIANSATFPPQALYAIAAAFTQGNPILACTRALRKRAFRK